MDRLEREGSCRAAAVRLWRVVGGYLDLECAHKSWLAVSVSSYDARSGRRVGSYFRIAVLFITRILSPQVFKT